MSKSGMNVALAEFIENSQLECAIAFLTALSRALLAIESEKHKVSLTRKISTIVGSTMLAVVIAYFVKQIASAPKWAPVGAAAAVGILAQHLMMRIVRRSEDIIDALEEKAKAKFCRTKLKRRDEE